MVLFDEDATIVPAPRSRMSRTTVAGLWAFSLAIVLLLVMSVLPTGYVIQQPGPVYDTLGSAQTSDGGESPLISVTDAETYPTTGSLDLLTVQVVGDRERSPSLFDLVGAWFDASRAVLPVDRVFPPAQTVEQRNQESADRMASSQQEATAAALRELGYDVTATLSIDGLTDDSPAAGVLQAGDEIVSVDGVRVSNAYEVREAVAAGQGEPVSVGLVRDGAAQTVSVAPRAVQNQAGGTIWVIGVRLGTDYAFPVDVSIRLDDVGGPSAGMMFALGIVDVLTPESLTGGRAIAGTGTIDALGAVGPIGGIRQKLYGARDAGAEFFLAPAANCDEVVGHVPDGIRVFSVADLDDALSALQTIRDAGDLDALPTCTPG